MKCILRASAYIEAYLNFDELLNNYLHKRSQNSWKAKLWNICGLHYLKTIVAIRFYGL